MQDHEPCRQLSYGTLATANRRDLIWILCSPIFEQIRVMTIPLSDMSRYLDSIERFKSLKNVVFKMDEMWDDDYFQDALSRTEMEDGVKELERIRDRRDDQFERMITFVKRHQALFPNELRKVDCPADCTWPRTVTCPKVISDRLQSLLLGGDRRTIINSHNVNDLADRITSMDLGQVEKISLEYQLTTLTSRDPNFLSRCRALKKMTIDAPGPGSFAWAVKERITWEEKTSRIGSSASHQWSPLIPLERLMLTTQRGFTDEPDDIVRAFGGTLKAVSFYDDTPEGTLGTEFRIGQDWRLPNLERFCSFVEKSRLLVDPDVYTSVFGENLTELTLLDKSLDYDVQDLYTCRPGSFRSLQHLTLKGWPALVFHPDTLHHTPHLETLEIELHSAIKPQEELLASFQQGLDLTLTNGSGMLLRTRPVTELYGTGTGISHVLTS